MEHSEFKFTDLGSGIVPIPEYRAAEVKFDLKEGLFGVYSEQLYSNLETNYGAEVPPKKDLDQFLFLLLYFRVKYARREKIPFKIRGTKLAIPAFFSQLLTSVGEVVSDEFAVILRPQCDQIYWRTNKDGQREDYSDDDLFRMMVTLSRKFRPFFDASNIIYATELPISRDGNINLMSLQVVNNVVYSESTKPEPIFAIMTSILCSKMSETVILPRVSYGALNYLGTHVIHIGDYERSQERRKQ